MVGTRNVPGYTFGRGSITKFLEYFDEYLSGIGSCITILDIFFQDSNLRDRLSSQARNHLVICDSAHEPSTEGIDNIVTEYEARYGQEKPVAIIGIGGGSALDTAKAVSNLLGNGGRAENYQGWDLLKSPGVYKIGIPTISGTGAEASRTCVLINARKNLKMGMNSDYSLFDHLVLDPELTRTVPRDQYFFTGMDTFIHCVESLHGHHRHAVADAYSREALRLCSEVFDTSAEDMQSEQNRERLMVASYLGGSAIANSLVGVVHPFSAGLTVAYGIHHCLANCIVMDTMEEFYPEAVTQFRRMLIRNSITLPHGICSSMDTEIAEKLYQGTIIHEKPLANALGADFRSVLTRDRVLKLFSRM
ncbi:MAG: iron-containing alcohol dehydrogenase [Spirochaetales bacterium]|nr:iron-containing alcohol dehydrogenase [Spirochaetales bacterium]